MYTTANGEQYEYITGKVQNMKTSTQVVSKTCNWRIYQPSCRSWCAPWRRGRDRQARVGWRASGWASAAGSRARAPPRAARPSADHASGASAPASSPSPRRTCALPDAVDWRSPARSRCLRPPPCAPASVDDELRSILEYAST